MFGLRPETLGVIGALRDRGLPIGLVSDCTIELPEAWSGLPVAPLVDVPLFSCLEGTRKPDPRLFRKVAAAACGRSPAGASMWATAAAANCRSRSRRHACRPARGPGLG